ncbi:Eco57I restriction-modification methylase domain-containing protein, partial [Phocaeicola coprocola]|uniref:Eco57I restriction-modification methylase domain-containing protein n=1 Tax=Phocaeicola coprocola TaxID=310298 RepID=UPI00195792CD
PQSWEEFMPKGVTKQKFNSFKKYYDPEIFCAAGKRIRAMARAADKLSIEERIERITDIFSTFRNPDKETVLTPWRVVNMHLGDCLGGYNFYDAEYQNVISEPRFIDKGEVTAEVFSPESRILEINSKSGLYPLYMAYGIYRARVRASLFSVETVEEQQAVWNKVIAENIFVICKTPMAKSITKRTLVGFRKAKVNTRYFEDLINQIKNKPENFIAKVAKGRSYWKAIDNDNMKFNVIVGNPPYQVMDGGTDRGAIPVYQYFMNIAKRIHPNFISLIMPARWYAGGRGLDEFRSDMISDTHISQLHDYELSKDLFPTVDIAGGLCTILWNAHYNGVCTVTNYNALKDITAKRYLNQFNILIRSNAAIPILEKVTSRSTSYLNNLVLSINPFGFRTYFRGSDKGNLKILTSKGWAKVYRTEVSKGTEYIDKFKIVVGRFVPSNGEMSIKPGDGYRVLTEPQILLPTEINTETYIDTAVFKTQEEATNYKKYLLTKFARFLLRQGITSVNVTKECFAFVPMQEFTQNSDIDWSKSLPDIDKQLYNKYYLTNEEIAFIEKMIKSMQ